MAEFHAEIDVSIVIPCYNEEENIGKMLAAFNAAFSGDSGGVEIIFVDNGSTDGTCELLQKSVSDFPFANFVHLPENLGYGHGILAGLAAAKGKITGYMHGDMQVLPESVLEIARSVSSTGKNEPFFFKARRYGRSFSEVFFTLGMTLFCSILFRSWLADINAQPTFFRKNFLADAGNFPRDFSFDLYLYLLAKKKGIRLIRKPVRVYQRARGVSSWNRGIFSKFVLSIAFMKAALNIRRTLGLMDQKQGI